MAVAQHFTGRSLEEAASRRRHAWAHMAIANMRLRWLAAAAAVCLLLIMSVVAGLVVTHGLRSDFAQIQEIDEAFGALLRLRSTTSELAKNHRRFLLTGDTHFLQQYRSIAQSLPEQLAGIGRLIAAMPQSSEQLGDVARLLALDTDAVNAIEARSTTAPPLEVAAKLTATEARYDHVRYGLETIHQQAHEFQAARIRAASLLTELVFDVSLLRTVVSIGFIGLLLYLLQRNAQVRDRLVSERSAALTEAAAALDRHAQERRNVEAALRHRDSLLYGLSDAIPQIVFLANHDGSGEFITRRWHEFTGGTTGFTEAQEWLRLVHPEDVTRLQERLHQARQLSAPLLAEFRLRSRHGQYLWFLAQAVPVADPGEADAGLWVGTFTDIDHLHRADAARRDSEERFRRIFEFSPFGMTVSEASQERRILQANAAFCRMLGYAPGELAGRSVNDLTHPEERDPGRPAALLARPDAGWQEVEKRYLSQEGKVVWARVRVGVFESPESAEPQLLAVIEDITRQREAEEALRQAQRMEAVGQLSGGLAHDFNNLLGVIIGNIECLLDTMTDDPERLGLARDILESALSGAELTRRLLAFGRRQPLAPQHIDLTAQVTRHVALLSRTLGRSVRIETLFAEHLWPTRADPSRLGDALLNLAINARDAMPHGGVLTIETYNERVEAEDAGHGMAMTPGDYVVLAVSDTGIGMPPEVRARAVEPFFTTKPPGAGSGLGLSMIYGFVQQSGGQLAISSEVGIGTTVRICLPRAAGEAEAPASEAPVRSLPTGQERILVVDDNAEMRQVAERHLCSLGYRVLSAANGPAALVQLQTGPHVDLLFTDISMPEGLTGFQLAAAARRLCPELRVLYTTGYAGRSDAAATPDWQQSLVRKPYRRFELAEKVRAVLSECPGQIGQP